MLGEKKSWEIALRGLEAGYDKIFICVGEERIVNTSYGDDIGDGLVNVKLGYRGESVVIYRENINIEGTSHEWGKVVFDKYSGKMLLRDKRKSAFCSADDMIVPKSRKHLKEIVREQFSSAVKKGLESVDGYYRMKISLSSGSLNYYIMMLGTEPELVINDIEFIKDYGYIVDITASNEFINETTPKLYLTIVEEHKSEFSPIFLEAYKLSQEFGYDMLNFNTNIANSSLEAIVSSLNLAGIKKFTISDTSTALLKMLSSFSEAGFKPIDMAKLKIPGGDVVPAIVLSNEV